MEYYEESARYVTPEEAMKNLVSAVILRAVLDYRDAVLMNTLQDNYGEYYIYKTKSIKELETFFEDVNFKLYTSLPDKIIKFKKTVNELTPDDFIEGKEKSYICPICGGTVKCHRFKVPSKHSHGGKKLYENRVMCEGCLIKASVM